MRLFAVLILMTIFYHSAAQGYLEGANLSDDLVPLNISNAAGKESFKANEIKLTDSITVYLD